jgi:hypothetical protein
MKKSIFALYYKFVLKKEGIFVIPNPLPEIYIDKVNIIYIKKNNNNNKKL